MKCHCSYYANVTSKQNQVITLAQFVTAIRSERWKAQVEAYRRCKAEGKLKEAETIKGKLPGVVSAGVCEGGHSRDPQLQDGPCFTAAALPLWRLPVAKRRLCLLHVE